VRRALPGGPVHLGLIYWGVSLAEDLTPLAVSLQLWIPFTAIFAWLVLGEKLSGPIIGGLLVAFAGVVFMTADPRAFRDWDAIVICAVASSAWALATVIARRTQAVAPIKMQGIIALVAFPTLALGSALFEADPIGSMQRATPLVWACVVFAALVSTVVATGLLFWLVQRREAGRVTAYLLVTPVVSAGIGIVFMGDVVDAQIIVGAIACIGGVGLVALAERWPRKTVAIESLGEG
jgi:O-acetylserine/cysteine efflux transporter